MLLSFKQPDCIARFQHESFHSTFLRSFKIIPIFQLCFHPHTIQFCLGCGETIPTEPVEGADTLVMSNMPTS